MIGALSKTEIDSILKNPDALRALANQHDCWETEADAIGDAHMTACAEYHKDRAKVLRDEADRIDAEEEKEIRNAR